MITPQHIDNRIIKLRNLLRKNDYDAIIITKEDEHLSEYLSPDLERLANIVGFTGSAGYAIILSSKYQENEKKGALFVDGRYIAQAHAQVDTDFFEIYHMNEVKGEDWLKTILPQNSVVAIDSKCISYARYQTIKKTLEINNIKLLSTPTNLVDEIWTNKSNNIIEYTEETNKEKKVIIYEDKYNGLPSIEKRKIIASQLRKLCIDATVISKSESVNWLLNVRGNDVPNLPIINSFAIVYSSEQIEWYVKTEKIPSKSLSQLQHHFGNVDYYNETELEDLFKRLGKNKTSIYIDERTTNAWIIESLLKQGCELTYGQDLCELPKAIKNPIEILGMKHCHLRDAVAMCKFLSWLDNLTESIINSNNENIDNSNIEQINNITEATLSDQLLKFRKEQDGFIEPSFDTISAIGSNAAIIHYNYKNVDNLKSLGQDPIYLVDSGGQYIDGTTDITRTVLVGPNLTQEIKDRFTLVLKGLISMHRVKFPKGTSGGSLDVLARAPLWSIGLNYDHGTGHGVGHLLNVHEGPHALSQNRGQIPLEEGMITSIEPGYYKENEYGIRCENLSIVEEVTNIQSTIKMLTLNPITFVPFDIRLINKDLLTTNEKNWINDYHNKVRELIKKHLNDKEISWLLKSTSAI